MPARVVDGDSLWRSKKLKLVQQRYRAEYANVLPLAEANGVFDCDPERVWADVYSFNRPEITLAMVEEILDEFEDAGLLRRWTEQEKTWGFWEGIKKSGRLPTEAHIKRYKNLPPDPPPNLTTSDNLSRIIPDNPGESGNMPEGFGIGIGIGIGIGLDRNGIGLGTEQQNDNSPFSGQEDDMKAKKQIPVSCEQILGIRAELHSDVWKQIDALAMATSNGQVVREFEEWAMENQLEEFRGRPVAAFLRSRDSVKVSEARQAAENPVVKAAGREIAYRTDNQVALNPKAKAILGKVVEESGYSVQEIVDAFLEFFRGIQDPSKIQYAGLNFAHEADDRLYAVRRKAFEKEKEASAIESAKARMQAEAEADRVRRAEEAEREAELMEEGLPD